MPISPDHFVPAVLGLIILLAGRKLFWFFTGVCGFVVTFIIASVLFEGFSPWLVWGLSLIAGIFGTMLALFLKRLSIAVSGFLSAAIFAYHALPEIGFANPTLLWAGTLLAGIAAAVLVAFLFEWTLILLSSLGGASLIGYALNLHGTALLITVAGLFFLGVLLQGFLLRKKKSAPSKGKP